ncbi:MAG: sugar transferase [Ruminococcaceae bacterium]|nr:sugar transferase [Oscillospiraceae bacterium]
MNTFYGKYVKRFLDVFLSCLALVVLAIPMGIVALLVAIKLGRPVLFIQDRPGKDEKIFRILKFRTMTNETDENGELLPDEVRLTKFGELLRKLSIDELPQLINIIKGDMSIIGPRALLVEYLPLYTEEEKIRHAVRPGLTNLVAVNGRNEVEMKDKLKYDIYYVNNLSFKLDLYILFKTVIVVLKREGTELEEENKMQDYATSDK